MHTSESTSTSNALSARFAEALDFAKLVSRAAVAKKADRPVAVMIGEIVEGLADAFVVVSGSNPRQVRTVAEEIERAVKLETGRAPRQAEGLEDATWVLLDYGDLVVHVFLEETRQYYDLEHLWKAARQIDLSEEAELVG